MGRIAPPPLDLARLVRGLMELDYDAIEAFRAAVARLGEDADRRQLAQLMDDHHRHVTDLAPHLYVLGEEAPRPGGLRPGLPQGQVAGGGRLDDKRILAALKTNEDDTVTAYERVAGHPDATAELRDVLERNLADERRHRAWLVERMEAM
ncbi:MAG TPA: ferritin-like domain-containing protein [Polyangia bacterium]|jgi:hypothetical protein